MSIVPLTSSRIADRSDPGNRSRSGEERSRGGAGFEQALGHGKAAEVPLLRQGHLHLGSPFEGRRGETMKSLVHQSTVGAFVCRRYTYTWKEVECGGYDCLSLVCVAG